MPLRSTKAQLKKVNPDFDVEHYDKLILETDEPQTLAPKDPIGFDQLDPIRTLGTTTGPSAFGEKAVASPSQAPDQPAEKELTLRPTSPLLLQLPSSLTL